MGQKVVLEDKKLFTPGPLTTSPGVKNAMLRDMGSRDAEFISTIQSIRQGLLKVANVDPEVWTTVPMQGSPGLGPSLKGRVRPM